ncbi:unnamed protein product [Sphagnum jensenii]|uniref:Uncharacterized protein n=1 Tax=Sphagnum jensenii TaxID=128206 RepID=A0ABP1AG86_9BRYO
MITAAAGNHASVDGGDGGVKTSRRVSAAMGVQGSIMNPHPDTGFLESRGMLEDLEIATDPDYKLDLAVQLGRLEIAKSHRLKARVLRLEAELPFVEKELLSETNHTHYAYSQGYVPSDVDRSVLTKVLMVPVHLKPKP